MSINTFNHHREQHLTRNAYLPVTSVTGVTNTHCVYILYNNIKYI